MLILTIKGPTQTKISTTPTIQGSVQTTLTESTLSVGKSLVFSNVLMFLLKDRVISIAYTRPGPQERAVVAYFDYYQ